MINLDNMATTKPLPCAVSEFERIIKEAPYNPSSPHYGGQLARNELENARSTIADIFHVKPDTILFTSGASESAVLATSSLYRDGVEVIPSLYEHHAVSENVERLQSPVKHRRCACQMLINNESGDILKRPEGFDVWMCDATSAVGHIPVTLNSENSPDILFCGAHKFGGILGAGILYSNHKVNLTPMIRGGGQERGMRAGTENVPAICAMAAALHWQCENMERNLLHVTRLRAEMLNRLKGVDYLVNAMGETSPYILNVSFMGVENGALALMLSNRGVMVSTGAACTTGDNAPSHVLMAMYGDEERARSAIRISFSHDTTEDEVRIAASEIVECVEMLRGMM